MDIVECHSGFRYAERPKALFWQGKRLLIQEIQAAWHIPGGESFQVSTQDERGFLLVYLDDQDQWQIEPI
jgi:hypothetical protein